MAEMTREEMMAKIQELEAKNNELKSKQPKAPKPTLKIGDKGTVSLYGLGRWPVSLYLSQWEKVLSMTDDIRKFIDDNRAVLAVKESKKE